MTGKNDQLNWSMSATIAPAQQAGQQAASPATIAEMTALAREHILNGRFDQARHLAGQIQAKDPYAAGPELIFGDISQAGGNLKTAQSHYERATRNNPGDPDAWLALGTVLFDNRNFNSACQALARAVSLQPAGERARWLLADAFSQIGRHNEAHELLDALCTEQPAHVDFLASRASNLMRMNRVDEALADATCALEVEPTNAVARYKVAQCLQSLGQFDEAENHLRTLIAKREQVGNSYRILALINRLSPDDGKNIQKMLQLLQPADGDRIPLLTAMATILNRQDRQGEAFSCLIERNRIRSAYVRHDRVAARRIATATIERASPDIFQRQHSTNTSARPVFIVGLPRSGTSLVEQIAAAHPSVYGAGELNDIYRLTMGLRTQERPFPQLMDHLGEGELDALAQGYLANLPEASAGFPKVVDKNPGNTAFLPMILRMFPNAAIVLCRRHPLDIAVSILFQQLSDQHSFALNLDDLADHIKSQTEIMDHMAKVAPKPPLELYYEDLVERLEPNARALVAHMGLDWNEACLNYHASRRAVTTSSLWQVRQPIYRTSRARWKFYKKQLSSVREHLKDVVTAHENELSRRGIKQV